jgi:hypothetical protein
MLLEIAGEPSATCHFIIYLWLCSANSFSFVLEIKKKKKSMIND